MLAAEGGGGAPAGPWRSSPSWSGGWAPARSSTALRTVDGGALAAAAGIAVLTTVCCAWRWSLVARGLGVGVPLRTAVAAYYRSQFLNTTLPGGVLGDVHRAVRHGRDVGDVGRGLRAVAWERSAGQVVQIVLTMIVLLVLPSPVRSSMPGRGGGRCWRPWLAVLSAGRCPGRAVPLGADPAHGPPTSATGCSHGGRGRASCSRPPWWWPATHATFLIAARTAGSTASPVRMLPLALLVLLAMGVPTNIGGWGPREGVAAWAFGAAGLGAAQGVATAVVYGVMVLVASLPGAVVLVVAWMPRTDRAGLRRGSPGRGRPLPPVRKAPHMADRPYTLLSCGMSIDGYLDSATEKRLLLSNDADFDRVDAVRAACDAILVGAATVRNDNPRLLVRSQARRDERVARGLPPSPIKVTVTGRAQLDPCANFFTTGDTEKLVYCASAAVAEARDRLGPVATVVDGGQPVDMRQDERGPLRPGRAAADGRGRRDGAHPVPDRRPRRRAAPGRRTVLRRRLPGPAVRQRRPVPLEPRPARDARRGAPDR